MDPLGKAHTDERLRTLARQLVLAAEKRGELKAQLARGSKAGKGSRTPSKSPQLDGELKRQSKKIEELLAAIGETSPRRLERWSGVMPVTLVVDSQGMKFEQPASTVDLSDRGMRIRTTATLTQGQTLEVFCWGKRVGCCRVVWVSPGGVDRPGEVGLEILY
jgi:hypothetical protein